MSRSKAPPSMRLKKAKSIKPVDPNAKPKLYALSVGTPNSMQPPDTFEKEAEARKKAIEFFQEREAWCARFNKAGLAAIITAIDEINAMPVLIKTPRQVRCLVDEYYGTVMVAILWKLDAPKPEPKTKEMF